MQVLVLVEFWLWPFELNKLSEISDNFEAVGKADVRLSESAQGSRGFGGICMLWHKATPISGINSDCICGISFSQGSSDHVMSVIGVYLDLGIHCYKEHLVELERVLSESETLGSVVILDDFNTHLSGWQKYSGRIVTGSLGEE